MRKTEAEMRAELKNSLAETEALEEGSKVSLPMSIGSLPTERAIPLIVEMLIGLQASADAVAMMLCDALRPNDPATAYDDYKERVQTRILEIGFDLSERFPLQPCCQGNALTKDGSGE